MKDLFTPTKNSKYTVLATLKTSWSVQTIRTAPRSFPYGNWSAFNLHDQNHPSPFPVSLRLDLPSCPRVTVSLPISDRRVLRSTVPVAPGSDGRSIRYAAPSRVNNAGIVFGLTQVVIKPLTSLDRTEPADPTGFAFFGDVSAPPGGDSIVTADVAGGLTAVTLPISISPGTRRPRSTITLGRLPLCEGGRKNLSWAHLHLGTSSTR